MDLVIDDRYKIKQQPIFCYTIFSQMPYHTKASREELIQLPPHQCIERKFPSIKVYYREEEPGCDVFYTNDADRIYFPERYFLDNYDEPLYYETIEEAAESVSEIVGHDVAPTVEAIEESLNNYEEEHEDEDVFYSFHEFLITDP